MNDGSMRTSEGGPSGTREGGPCDGGPSGTREGGPCDGGPSGTFDGGPSARSGGGPSVTVIYLIHVGVEAPDRVVEQVADLDVALGVSSTKARMASILRIAEEDPNLYEWATFEV